MHKTKLLVVLFTAIVFGAVPAFAGEPIIWDIGSRADLLKGEAHGISISDTGVVTLAPRANELFNTEQAYVWSTAIDAAGNVYLGHRARRKTVSGRCGRQGLSAFQSFRVGRHGFSNRQRRRCICRDVARRKGLSGYCRRKIRSLFRSATTNIFGRSPFSMMVRWQLALATTASSIGCARRERSRKHLCSSILIRPMLCRSR